jgi:hypothetical protein
MIDAIIIICIIKLAIAQEAQFGAVASKVVVSVIHIAKAHGAAIVGPWAHVSIVSLTVAQDVVVPFGALFVDVVGAIFLALTAVKAALALPSPVVQCMLVTLLLCHLSDGGVIDESGTDSMTITPCRSLSIAIAGTVVVMSLVMSLNGMINMATIVCSG